MAGHSRWANIKHKKAKSDARRGKLWSKCAKAIIVAAKNGGGDPAANLTLRYAVDDAKAANMPKDTIEKAIKKGTGELGGENYESAMYEGYGPGGVAIMLEILTDNRNRTAGEVRKIFERAGGNLGASGCVAYNFAARGQIFLPKSAGDEDTIMTAALEAGALDVKDSDDTWLVLTEPTEFVAVRSALESAKFAIESAGLTMVPNMTVTCTGDDAKKILNLVDQLEDHDDVQKVHANFEIPDAELAALEG
jgi:YebC/PmpR family DNA-binding regulatory protein